LADSTNAMLEYTYRTVVMSKVEKIERRVALEVAGEQAQALLGATGFDMRFVDALRGEREIRRVLRHGITRSSRTFTRESSIPWRIDIDALTEAELIDLNNPVCSGRPQAGAADAESSAAKVNKIRPEQSLGDKRGSRP